MLKLKSIMDFVFPPSRHDWNSLIEGVWADQYQDPEVKQQIRERYQQRWCPEPTPQTHPQQFDPLQPPQGWRYDPYYEIWIEIT